MECPKYSCQLVILRTPNFRDIFKNPIKNKLRTFEARLLEIFKNIKP